MADEEAAKDEKAEDKPAKKSKKKLIIIIAALIIILGGGGAGYFLFLKEKPVELTEEEAAEAAAALEEAESTATVVAFEPFVVNLLASGGNRYLKITINMEVDESMKEEVEAKTAQIRDSVIILLSSKEHGDIISVAGKYQLRDEIAARVNMIISKGKIKSVYFTEFVIQ